MIGANLDLFSLVALGDLVAFVVRLLLVGLLGVDLTLVMCFTGVGTKVHLTFFLGWGVVNAEMERFSDWEWILLSRGPRRS